MPHSCVRRVSIRVSPRELSRNCSSVAEQIVKSGVAPHGFVAWDGYGPWFVTQYNSRPGELSGAPDNGRSGEPVARVDFASPEIVDSFDWLRAEVEAAARCGSGGILRVRTIYSGWWTGSMVRP